MSIKLPPEQLPRYLRAVVQLETEKCALKKALTRNQEKMKLMAADRSAPDPAQYNKSHTQLCTEYPYYLNHGYHLSPLDTAHHVIAPELLMLGAAAGLVALFCSGYLLNLLLGPVTALAFALPVSAVTTLCLVQCVRMNHRLNRQTAQVNQELYAQDLERHAQKVCQPQTPGDEAELSRQIETLRELLKRVSFELTALYEQGVLWPDHRNLASAAELLHLFATRQVTRMEGPNGGAALYEREMVRRNMAHSPAAERELAPELCQALTECDTMAQSLSLCAAPHDGPLPLKEQGAAIVAFQDAHADCHETFFQPSA